MLGKLLLAGRQDVDGKGIAGLHFSMRLTASIHAHKQQQRVERQGRQRVDGESVTPALTNRRYHRHTGREVSHRAAEVGYVHRVAADPRLTRGRGAKGGT